MKSPHPRRAPASAVRLAAAPACSPASACWPFPASGRWLPRAGWRPLPAAQPRGRAPGALSGGWLGPGLVRKRGQDGDPPRTQALPERFKPIDPALRAAEYRKEGWKSFDPKAPAYRPSEAEIERMRREHDLAA